LHFTIDHAFAEVISACKLSERPEQEGTWITEEVEEAYRAAHRLGFAHSVEAWTDTGELVGGVYGVDSGGTFGGESMFHRQSDASKLALLYLVDHLESRGATFLDIQMMTPHMKALGAVEIPRRDFLERLSEERSRNLRLFDSIPAPR
jgi:leucyl/phenylalanyl-tRNA--protein transferase